MRPVSARRPRRAGRDAPATGRGPGQRANGDHHGSEIAGAGARRAGACGLRSHGRRSTVGAATQNHRRVVGHLTRPWPTSRACCVRRTGRPREVLGNGPPLRKLSAVAPPVIAEWDGSTPRSLSPTTPVAPRTGVVPCSGLGPVVRVGGRPTVGPGRHRWSRHPCPAIVSLPSPSRSVPVSTGSCPACHRRDSSPSGRAARRRRDIPTRRYVPGDSRFGHRALRRRVRAPMLSCHQRAGPAVGCGGARRPITARCRRSARVRKFRGSPQAPWLSTDPSSSLVPTWSTGQRGGRRRPGGRPAPEAGPGSRGATRGCGESTDAGAYRAGGGRRPGRARQTVGGDQRWRAA